MAKAEQLGWGDWVRDRAAYLGIRRLADLATAIGCRPEQLSRWLQMSEPPARMLKGFDRALARALKTTAHMLFVDFRSTVPDAAPQATWALPGVKLEDEQFDDPKWKALSDEKKMGYLCLFLNSEDRQWIIETMIRLARTQQAADRQAGLEQLVSRPPPEMPNLPPIPVEAEREIVRRHGSYPPKKPRKK